MANECRKALYVERIVRNINKNGADLMNEVFKYKGFIGSIETSLEDMCVHGKLLFINDLVTYEAENLEQLKQEFEAAVDDYLKTCKKLKREPQKPYKGSLNIRIGSELHKRIALQAILLNISINEYIRRAVNNQIIRDAG